MKSVFLSILIFIAVFAALKLDIMVLFSGRYLFYAGIIGFICVISCALYFVGLPTLKTPENNTEKSPTSTSSPSAAEPTKEETPE